MSWALTTTEYHHTITLLRTHVVTKRYVIYIYMSHEKDESTTEYRYTVAVIFVKTVIDAHLNSKQSVDLDYVH